MSVARYRDSALRESWVKELPVAAPLPPQLPSLFLKSFQNLPHFHENDTAAQGTAMSMRGTFIQIGAT
jgi:hypothetical protein